jgi:hypothetical protein
MMWRHNILKPATTLFLIKPTSVFPLVHLALNWSSMLDLTLSWLNLLHLLLPFSFAPQLPLPKSKPGITTTLACYVPLPLLEFTSAPVATAATLVADTPVSRYDALTIEMCGNPFGPSFDEPINIQGSHVTAGLLLLYGIDRGRFQSTAMQPGTPANHIHTWKSRIRGAYSILRINNHDVTSILDVKHAVRDARLSHDTHITVTLTFDKIVNTLNHAGLPQLYFDQM